MILPGSSSSNYRKPGTLGTVDYYYRLLNQKLGEYILPIAGAVFLLLTIFSTYHLPIPSLNLTHSELYYIWIGALVSLLITVLIASVKYIKPYTHHRKIWIVLSTVIAFTLVIGLLHVLGISPLYPSPLSISIAQGVTCPSSIGTDGSQPAYCELFYYGGDYGSASNLLGSVQVLPGQSTTCGYTYGGSTNGYLYGTNYCVFSTVQCPPGTSFLSYTGPGDISCSTSSSSTTISSSTISGSSSTSSSSSISGSLTTDSVTKIFTEVEASIVGFFYI
jgi:hypothetical protein